MRIGVSRFPAVRLMAVTGLLLATSLSAHGAFQERQEVQPANTPLLTPPGKTHGSINFVQIDMNFDGQKDLAVVRLDELSSEPSVTYFLYDQRQKRFSRNLALGKLPSPEFDAHTKRVKTGWQKRGTRKVLETYGWSSNRLKLLERREVNLKTQECVSFRYAWVNETQWKIGQRAC